MHWYETQRVLVKESDTDQRHYDITNIENAEGIIAYLFQDTTDFQPPVVGNET